ncbi:MAG: carboxypeptidase-like regulatory domain-containing protein, partial [Muribaculaceae bacterium]|nr:carboxypeptidase-like regulatory domain-containing protein [Muribaculaceae bacterium]
MELKKYIVLLLSVFMTMPMVAQKLTGVIVDDDDGECIPYASAVYRGNHVMVSSNGEGEFSIDRHNGWKLTFSAVGYQPLTVEISANTKSPMRISLKPEKTQLQNVTVRGRRNRYSRKDNPAVELMRRVIAAKKKTNLNNHDFYQYNKYQKLTLAFNDLSPQDMESGIFGKKQWALDQMELCPYNNKLILPVSVDETVTRKIYRKDPKSEKDIIMGQNTSGLNDLFETGDILNTVLKDVFTDVDLYDNQMRLLQYPFTSPIADNAISFYRYYIEDTTFVDRDKCYHLQFMPNNQQDFGFRGELYIIADSTLHVRKCTLTIPKKSDVNFVD